MNMMQAIESRKIEHVKQAIESGGDIHRIPDFHMTPLMYACTYGDRKAIQIVQLLLDEGVDVNDGINQDTALGKAAMYCDEKVVKLLLDAGAQVNGHPDTSFTPLMWAARENNIKALNVLIEHGADLDAKCKIAWAKGKTALWLAENDAESKKAAKRLREVMNGQIKPIVPKAVKMPELLAQLDELFSKHRMKFLSYLNPPASDREIHDFENSIKVSLPESIKQLYSWHNGHPDENFVPFHVITNESFMPLEEVLDTYQEMISLLQYGDITEEIWDKNWIPFAEDLYGNYVCVDLSPNYFGQIIQHNHEGGSGKVLYNSINEWLQDLIEEMQEFDFDAWNKDESLA